MNRRSLFKSLCAVVVVPSAVIKVKPTSSLHDLRDLRVMHTALPPGLLDVPDWAWKWQQHLEHRQHRVIGSENV